MTQYIVDVKYNSGEVARNAHRAELELASNYEGCFDDDSPLGFDGPTAAD